MVEIEQGSGAERPPKLCTIRFRSRNLISAGDEGICDDEASAAKKTRTGNQSFGVGILAVSAS